MLLPETKEREYRFRLALRMVLPIFALVFTLIFHSFITNQEILNGSFYIESILILVFSTYFIFYLIYMGFDTKITDDVSKVFTREYTYKYLKKELKNYKEYTLLLVSVDNLYEINNRYGIKNGDKILFETIEWIGDFFKSKDIINFPIGRIKGGDFIIGLKGDKNQYKTVIELMCLKSEDFKINDIEIQISTAMNDTKFSNNLDYLIENLFELQSQNKSSKIIINTDEEINPNELEYCIVNSIKKEELVIFTQNIFENENIAFRECFIKFNAPNGKLLHQKDYMKVLDKLRLMSDYDFIVFKKIINICKKTDNEKFAISISATSIRNPVFLIKIKELLYKNESVKERIIVLISENEYYPKVDKFNNALQEIRDFGIKIALDRLGSIHTTFLYLKDLDVDIVRFSSTFVKKIDEDKNRVIINGFNIMAHQKKIKTWAKMVENENIKNILKDLNVDYLQGKHLAQIEKI